MSVRGGRIRTRGMQRAVKAADSFVFAFCFSSFFLSTEFALSRPVQGERVHRAVLLTPKSLFFVTGR